MNVNYSFVYVFGFGLYLFLSFHFENAERATIAAVNSTADEMVEFEFGENSNDDIDDDNDVASTASTTDTEEEEKVDIDNHLLSYNETFASEKSFPQTNPCVDLSSLAKCRECFLVACQQKQKDTQNQSISCRFNAFRKLRYIF